MDLLQFIGVTLHCIPSCSYKSGSMYVEKCFHRLNGNGFFKKTCFLFSQCFNGLCNLLCLFLYRYEYRWADGVTIKKPIEVSAPKYVEYLMDWIESQLDNEMIFPQKLG